MLNRKEIMFLLMNETSKSSAYGGTVSSSNPVNSIPPGAVVVAAIVAFILAIILLVTIVERKKAPRGKFLKWLREYLNFRSILISGIIKFVYLFFAVFLTIMSVVVMCQGRDEMVLPMIGIGFAMMIFGNIFLRIMLELTMALIVVWENTSDIRGVLVKNEEMPEEKPPKEPKEKEVVEEKPAVAEEVIVEQQQTETPELTESESIPQPPTPPHHSDAPQQ